MAVQPVVDVSAIVENQKLSKFLVRLVVISWVVTFFDGFDIQVISFAAPYLTSQFHLSKIMMGKAFSAGLFGTIFGAFLFGYIGDWMGRRKAIILAACWFGIATFLLALTPNYTYLLYMRFVEGIAIGGFLPLIWALNIEYSPKRYRSTLVTLNMVGYAFGVVVGGPIAVVLIPRFGWPSLFVFGGGCTVIAAVFLIAMLPESIRFLASKRSSPAAIARIVRRMVPEQTFPDNAHFAISDEGGQGRKFQPGLLFVGELRWITPLLWVSYVCSSLTAFCLTNWTVMVFEALHFSHADAAWALSVSSFASMIGGMAIMRFTDTRGAIAITIMPACAVVVMLVGGLVEFGHAAFFVLFTLMVGFAIGAHTGMHSIAGIFYPSSYRSNGTGWASAIAKIGATAGPLIGGFVLASGLKTQNLFAVLAIFQAVLTVTVYSLGRVHRRILGREALEAPPDVLTASAAQS
jgi:AAHS family 4-hydroxybenzoate transporter-like MFS transporter